MKPSEIIGKMGQLLKDLILAAGVCCTILTGSLNTADASCLDLSDIPLDTLQQAAPGMIMFVMDDSGSMDWSIMCPPDQESSGVFNGSYYVFPNPGDNEYGYGNLEENDSNRMRWMSQWAGYNGMYYDPETDYTAWPSLPDADPDNPRSNPVISSNTLNMNEVWQTMDELGFIVDNRDAGFSNTGTWGSYWISDSQYGSDVYLNTGSDSTYSATWTVDNLPSANYNVYVKLPWDGVHYDPTYYQRQYVTYEIYNGSTAAGTLVDTITVDQHQDANLYTDQWLPLTTNQFFSGIGSVTFEETLDPNDSQWGSGSGYYYYQLTADAVKFEPVDPLVSDIMRRHYYVRIDSDTYLVNITNLTYNSSAEIEYYRVLLDNPSDNRETVTASKLRRLVSPTDDAEIAALDALRNNRSYSEEVQNFANWYSFYRRRELTAKNAIANVINTSDGLFIGLIFINDYRGKDQRVLPVKVNLDGTFYDESATLLDILYNYQIDGYGTPLRNGLKKAGRFFQGSYLKPATFISQVNSDSYPYFKADNGGSCEQAFTILFTDGYYNGGSPYVDNADGDNNTDYDGDPFGDSASDTLADVAMYYFERDLNTTLSDDVPITDVDPADHQHMVTYTIAFGVTGDLDTELYADCPQGTCPSSWPSTGTSTGKIDDMFHAAVNGRGKFISAQNTAELNEALETLKNDIDSRLGAAAALATNSIQLTVGSVLYQGTYNTSNWYGEVSALSLNVTTGVVGDAVWRASDHVPDHDARTILSYTGSTGIAFEVGNLTTTQQSLLTASGLGTAADLVDYIRGDRSKDVAHGGTLRTRNHPLGDFVHSSPTYFENVVYIGGNDGMLHAFDAGNGAELFAYIPSFVYDHLSNLADAGYSHQFYVDNTAMVAKTDTKDILVCGLRKGGKGYFALDVTHPTAMGASNVLWEYPSDATGTDDDMGYSYSKAFIVKTEAEGYVAIFGNGYDSVNGEAVLYVLNAETGALIKKFNTGVTGCNGLSTPAIVDVELDGIVDYAFAGDLKGNMWKFDLRGSTKSEWDIAYRADASTPMPLITVQNTSGEIQSITAPPDVMLDCVVMEEGRGLMLVFGTGKYLNNSDFNDTTVQSFYGVWDWGPMWEQKEGDLTADQTKYLGTLNTDRTLSNMSSGIGLLEQTVIYQTTEWLVTSNNPIYYYNPVSGSGSHMGWVFDLTAVGSGERSLRDPTLRDGVVVFISTIPSDSPCAAGGSSVIYQLSGCSGGRVDDALFDIDEDEELTEDDYIIVGGKKVYVQGKIVDKILFDLLEISGEGYTQDSDGDINNEDLTEIRAGMFYWRYLGQ